LDLALESRAFRQVAGQFATGVTIVAMEAGENVQAMTANSFTAVSLDPPLILFCAGKHTHTGKAVHTTKHFSINILRQDQQPVAAFFAGQWKESEPPPFHFVPWTGGPRLEGSAASLGCELAHIYEAGDHWIVLGRVIALHLGVEPRRPLIFIGGRFTALEKPGAPAPDLAGETEPVVVHYDSWQP